MHPNHQYICEKCQQRFKEKTALRAHLIQRHRQRFACTHCNRNYSRFSTLNAHKMVHHFSDANAAVTFPKFICHTCGKDSFTSRKGLAAHLRLVHERKVKAVCFVCEKAFVDRTRFKHHMKIHTGDRPFKCEICKLNN